MVSKCLAYPGIFSPAFFFALASAMREFLCLTADVRKALHLFWFNFGDYAIMVTMTMTRGKCYFIEFFAMYLVDLDGFITKNKQFKSSI
jgi:hypothetical protein